MRIFLASLFVALVQSCLIHPEPHEFETNFIIVNAIDESFTSHEELCHLLNFKDDDFEFPKLITPPVFTMQGQALFEELGFCNGETSYEQVVFSVQANQSIMAMLYGCDLFAKKDVQIVIYDAETILLGVKKTEKENINRRMSSAFCKCSKMIEEMEKCSSEDEIFQNNRFVLLFIMIGVCFLMVLVWIHEDFIEQSND